MASHEADDWVPAWQVFKQVRDFCEAHTDDAGDLPEQRAETIILRRLEAGTVSALAEAFSLQYREHEYGKPYYRTFGKDERTGLVPTHFWRRFCEEKSERRVDWLAGDFSFVLSMPADDENETDRCEGMAHGVRLRLRQLPGGDFSNAHIPVDDQMPATVLSGDGDPESLAGSSSDTTPEPRANNHNPRRPPRLPEARLKRWWDSLTAGQRDLPHDDLMSMCKLAHPKFSISRQRIRDLTLPRKRGPKPFRDKLTAE